MFTNKHTLYLAGLLYDAAARYKSRFTDDEVNTLLSNGRVKPGYLETFVKNCNHFNSIILDSGTWTLNNVSEDKDATKADFHTYLTYLNYFKHHFDYYFNYDEDFSKTRYWTNQNYQDRLEQANHTPIYVIHDAHNRQEIDFCLRRGYKMVAIGSAELKGPIDELREIVMFFHAKRIKVHFLGCTQFERLATMPVFSCDSSTWTRMGSEGYVLWWNKAKSDFDKTEKIYLKTNGPKSARKHYIEDNDPDFRFRDYLRLTHGLTPLDLKGKSSGETLINRAMVNMKYFIDLQEQVRQEHTKRGYTF
jgi:hypothetical protein